MTNNVVMALFGFMSCLISISHIRNLPRFFRFIRPPLVIIDFRCLLVTARLAPKINRQFYCINQIMCFIRTSITFKTFHLDK